MTCVTRHRHPNCQQLLVLMSKKRSGNVMCGPMHMACEILGACSMSLLFSKVRNDQPS